VLGGLALLTVIVLTVAATLLFTREGAPSSDPPTASAPPTSSVDTSGIASADDDGPVGIITEDPTCAAWTPIAETLSARASNGWNGRDASIPATAWTPAQKAQHEEMANAMRSAADQTVDLVRSTPHRVMRQLYEQSVAYWRAYAEAVPTYSKEADYLARTATAATNAINWICSAISFGSAALRAPLVAPAPAGHDTEKLGDPANPRRYVVEPLSVCTRWISTAEKLDNDTADWLNADPNISAAEWPAGQAAIYRRVAPLMQTAADEFENLGAQSLNLAFNDFAALSTVYKRAYVQSFPSYVPADAYLANAAAELVATNGNACRAAGAS
jgi:hypothetical protein